MDIIMGTPQKFLMMKTSEKESLLRILFIYIDTSNQGSNTKPPNITYKQKDLHFYSKRTSIHLNVRPQ